jgi:hypothetical protein
VGTDEWEIYVVDEVRDWIMHLDLTTKEHVVHAIDVLAETWSRVGAPDGGLDLWVVYLKS